MISVGRHDAWAAAVADAPVVVHVRLGVDTAALDDWVALCGLGPTGALLVRPDQHVAWRAVDGDDPVGIGQAIAALSGGR